MVAGLPELFDYRPVKTVRVCHIISGDLWAGAEVMAYHLFKGLLKYPDIETSIILLNDGRLANEIRKLSIPVFVVDEGKKSLPRLYRDIRRILVEIRPNIIHSHRYKENILGYLASKAVKNSQLVATQHGMPEMYEGNNNLKNRITAKVNFSLLSRNFKNVVTVSQDIRKAFIEQFGFRENKVKVIHNGIEVYKDITQINSRNVFVIGSSGRFFAVKNYPFMVQIARIAIEKEKANNIRFELAGDGPEMTKIQSLIKKYGLEEKFILRGFMDDIFPFYQGLDLYLCTSLHEGIPMSVLEAMSYGIPVIAPKVGGLTEIITDGVEGYLVESRTPEDFAERCIFLYENKSLRKQMGSAARERVKKEFSVEHMARQYYQLYLDVSGKR